MMNKILTEIIRNTVKEEFKAYEKNVSKIKMSNLETTNERFRQNIHRSVGFKRVLNLCRISWMKIQK